MSPVKRNNPADNGSVPRAANASPMQLRLMEVLNQVDSASEFAMKVSAAAPPDQQARMRSNSEVPPSSTPSSSNTPSCKSYAGSEAPTRKPPSGGNLGREAKETARHMDRHDEVEDEDDLEYTLDNWLTQQKRGVTQRKKHGPGYPAPLDLDADDAPGCESIDDGIDGYSGDAYQSRTQ